MCVFSLSHADRALHQSSCMSFTFNFIHFRRRNSNLSCLGAPPGATLDIGKWLSSRLTSLPLTKCGSFRKAVSQLPSSDTCNIIITCEECYGA
jgi:hypothetical protein